MAQKQYFFQGYKGNPKVNASDFSHYTDRELKQMMKVKATRLNTRLASLERENISGSSYAHMNARVYTYDKMEFMRPDSNISADEIKHPRFKTNVAEYEEGINIYDSRSRKAGLKRERTREEIIEQLVAMEHFESLTESTVSGMMAKYKAKYDYQKAHDPSYTETFDDYISKVKSESYQLIAKYYGYETADHVYALHATDTNNGAAVDNFIASNPEYFRKDNSLQSQGGLLLSEYASWYEANWEDVNTTPEEDKSILDSI